MGILSRLFGEEEVYEIDGVPYEPKPSVSDIQNQGSAVVVLFVATPYIFFFLILFQPEFLDLLSIGLLSGLMLSLEAVGYMNFKQKVHQKYEARDVIFAFSKLGVPIVEEELVIDEIYMIAEPENLMGFQLGGVGEKEAVAADVVGSEVSISLSREMKLRMGFKENEEVVVNFPSPYISNIQPFLTPNSYLYLVKTENGNWRYIILPYPWNEVTTWRTEIARSGFSIHVKATVFFEVLVGFAYAPMAKSNEESETGSVVPVYAVTYSLTDLEKRIRFGRNEVDLHEVFNLFANMDKWMSHQLHAQLLEWQRQANVYKDLLETRKINVDEAAEKMASTLIQRLAKGLGSIYSQYRTRLESFLVEWGLPIIVGLSVALVVETIMLFLG